MNFFLSLSDLNFIEKLSSNKIDELIRHINSTHPHKIFNPAGDSRDLDKAKIICPICSNGTGQDATPVEVNRVNGVWLYHCFKCGEFQGDLLKIIASHEQLNLHSRDDLCKAVAIGATLCNVSVIADSYSKPTAELKHVEEIEQPKPDFLKLVAADIADAQQHLSDLPKDQRRALSGDTLSHFGVGFLARWTHPNARFNGNNWSPSRRIIIPTSNRHYNAVMLPADRNQQNKKYWKQHTKPMELFNQNALNSDSEIVIVVEGEFDAMSIWQAFDGNINVVATLGNNNWKSTLFPYLDSIHSKKFLILFDAEPQSRNSADNLRRALIKRGFHATCRFYFDALLALEDKIPFSFDIKIDANEILQNSDNDFLRKLTQNLIEDAQNDLLNNSDSRADFQLPETISVDNRVSTRDRIYSCPVNLFLPDNFIFDLHGITKIIPPFSSRAKIKYIKVAHTPILPTKKFIDPINGSVDYQFAIFADNIWHFVDIDGSALADARDLAKSLAKHHALIDKRDLLIEFFNEIISSNSASLNKIKSFNQTGWTSNDCEEFAFPSPNSDSVIRRPGYDFERIFKPKGDPNAWIKKFSEVTKMGGAVADIVIGAACAAPLVKPLEGLPNIQLHLAGNRSIGKTPLLKFAVSIFGDSNFGALSHTFAATPKSQLETATAFSDLPLIFDEFEAITKNGADSLSQNIYNFSLGIAGQALTRQGTKRQTKLFSGARLTTGEHQLVHSYGNAGEFKRVLDLYCTDLLDENFASDLYSFCNRHRGLFGLKWIQYIKNNRDLISRHFRLAISNSSARNKQLGKEIDRTLLAQLAACAVAFQHFKICIGLQEFGDNEQLLHDIDYIISLLPSIDDIDDASRAIEFLKDFVAGHEKFFWHTVKNPSSGRKEDISHFTNEGYGKIFENGEVAFFPSAFSKILEVDGKFKSAKKLRREFFARDFLRTRNGEEWDRAWFGGKAQTVIRFRENILSAPLSSPTDFDLAI